MPRQRIVAVLVVAAVLVVSVVWGVYLACGGARQAYRPQERHYFIAAQPDAWNYSPPGETRLPGITALPAGSDQLAYTKTRYIEYTDAGFKTRAREGAGLGILGPIVRGVPGDTIVITFRNMAGRPYNLESDNLPAGAKLRTGAGVAPGGTATYVWKLGAAAGPAAGQGSSRMWLYGSSVAPTDVNDGLLGAVIVTSAQHALPDGRPDDVDREFVSVFKIFDESTPQTPADQLAGAQKHTVNGRLLSSLGYGTYVGERLRWHLAAAGSDADLSAADWQGLTPRADYGSGTDTVGAGQFTTRTADIVPNERGVKGFHAIHSDHQEFGMVTVFFVAPAPNRIFEVGLRDSVWLWPVADIVLVGAWVYAERRRAMAGPSRFQHAVAGLAVVSVAILLLNHETRLAFIVPAAITLVLLPIISFIMRSYRS